MAELNQLNLSMQGKQKILIDTVDKISAFKDKLCLWSARVEKNKFASFPNLNLILEDANDDAVQEKMKQIVLTHLKNLCVQFDKYIPEKMKEFEWVKNPFTFAIDPDDDRLQFSENMIELQNDTGLNRCFRPRPKLNSGQMLRRSSHFCGMRRSTYFCLFQPHICVKSGSLS